MDSLQLITDRFKENREVTQETVYLKREILRATECMVHALKAGKKIIAVGNGGSAEQASHFVAELAGRFKIDRRPLRALALGTNLDLLTAVANDYDFETVFSRELEAVGEKGDVVLLLSTSGNSKNILRVGEKAHALGVTTIGLTGAKGTLRERVDIALAIASSDTPRIQEAHLLIIHIISELIEQMIFSDEKSD